MSYTDYESEAIKRYSRRMDKPEKEKYPVKVTGTINQKIDDDAVRRGAFAPIPGRFYKATKPLNRNSC